jgi:hypothetical protein
VKVQINKSKKKEITNDDTGKTTNCQ